jgi:hypothetical protein
LSSKPASLDQATDPSGCRPVSWNTGFLGVEFLNAELPSVEFLGDPDAETLRASDSQTLDSQTLDSQTLVLRRLLAE